MKYISKIMFCLMFFLSPLLSVANAEIFKCVNTEGATYYNDKPCPKADEETQINAVKDPENGYIPPAFVADDEPNSAGVTIGNNSSRDIKKNNNDSHNAQLGKQSTSRANNSSSNNSDGQNDRVSATSQTSEYSSNSSSKTSSTSSNSINKRNSRKLNVINLEPANYKAVDEG